MTLVLCFPVQNVYFLKCNYYTTNIIAVISCFVHAPHFGRNVTHSHYVLTDPFCYNNLLKPCFIEDVRFSLQHKAKSIVIPHSRETGSLLQSGIISDVGNIILKAPFLHIGIHPAHK